MIHVLPGVICETEGEAEITLAFDGLGHALFRINGELVCGCGTGLVKCWMVASALRCRLNVLRAVAPFPERSFPVENTDEFLDEAYTFYRQSQPGLWPPFAGQKDIDDEWKKIGKTYDDLGAFIDFISMELFKKMMPPEYFKEADDE